MCVVCVCVVCVCDREECVSVCVSGVVWCVVMWM